jgi:hypothetical protein
MRPPGRCVSSSRRTSLTRSAILITILLAAGCGSDTQPASSPGDDVTITDLFTTTVPTPELERKLARALPVAQKRRDASIAANRRALDSLPVFPGSRVISERQNPQDRDEDFSDETLQFENYAAGVLSDDDYQTLTSENWGTFRDYAVPKGTPPQRVYEFFVAQMSDWRIVGEERISNVRAGKRMHTAYSIGFRRNERCVWFHIGLNTYPRLAPGRSFEVASQARDRDGCPLEGLSG